MKSDALLNPTSAAPVVDEMLQHVRGRRERAEAQLLMTRQRSYEEYLALFATCEALRVVENDLEETERKHYHK